MFKVYLAGYIHGEVIDKCIGWRQQIKEYYAARNASCNMYVQKPGKTSEKIGFHDITWLDPLNGKKIGQITPDGLKSDIPGAAILQRDFMSVSMADLVVASLESFGKTRPMVGTLSEIAWCYPLKKPLIVITDELNYKEHPFIKNSASIIVPTVEELLDKDYISYFYKGATNAY